MTSLNELAVAETDASAALGSAWGDSNRREFLKLAAAGAAALGLTTTMSGCVLAAAGTRNKSYGALIPGGGIRIPIPNRFELRGD